MLSKLLFLAVGASAVRVQWNVDVPQSGMMKAGTRERLTDSEGNIDLDAAYSADDVPDETVYPGEDVAWEEQDAAEHWKMGKADHSVRYTAGQKGDGKEMWFD